MKKSKKKVKVPVKKVSKKLIKKSNPVVQKNKLGTPYGDRVLVKPVTAAEVTSFGIIIPDSSKEKPEQGVVVAVGPGKRGDDNELIPVGVNVGDTIMFNKYGYDEVKIDGTEYYLIREDNISHIL
jgi:chaperonin GroES